MALGFLVVVVLFVCLLALFIYFFGVWLVGWGFLLILRGELGGLKLCGPNYL